MPTATHLYQKLGIWGKLILCHQQKDEGAKYYSTSINLTSWPVIEFLSIELCQMKGDKCEFKSYNFRNIFGIMIENYQK